MENHFCTSNHTNNTPMYILHFNLLCKNGRCPTLTDVQQPEGNNATSTTPTPSPAITSSYGEQPREDGRTYYTSGSNYLRPDCPRHPDQLLSGRGGRGRGSVRDDRNGGRGGRGAADQPRTAMAAWKYIHPMDSKTIVEINGTTWKFCNRCVCSVTRKVGFYNKTYTTNEHTDPRENPYI